MKLESMKERREHLLRQIEFDQNDLKQALTDLKVAVSPSEKIREYPRSFLLGAFIGGIIIGELT